MMLSNKQALIIITVVALGTLITRALPFILFPNNKETPEYIRYLSNVIPYAAISLLVVYCLKGVSFTAAPFGIPEVMAILSVIIFHQWKSNTLLSIGGGTLVYMLLVQTVFS